jgi:hypothetical protein
LSCDYEIDLSKFRHPLTDDQLVQLRPFLNTMVVRFGRCQADRDDYIQAAYQPLITDKVEMVV